MEMGLPSEAEHAFDEARQVATEHEDEVTAAYAEVMRTRPLANMSRAVPLLDDAIAVLERHGAGTELVEAYLGRAWRGTGTGRANPEALADSDRAIEILNQLDDAPVRLRIMALETRGGVSLWFGDPRAEAALIEAIDLASAHGASSILARIRDLLAIWKALTGDLRAAAALFEAGVRTAEITGRRNDQAHSSGNLADVLVILGDPEAAVTLCQRAAADNVSPPENVQNWIELWTSWAWAQVVLGDLDGAEATLARALPLTHEDEDVAGLLVVAVERQWALRHRDGDDEHSIALLELLRDPAAYELFRQVLSRLARILAADDELDLLADIIEDTPAGIVLFDCNTLSARATLSQARGDHAEALGLYDGAATAWASYGYPLEQAHALIGGAQCRTALGQPASAQLEEARSILERIGAGPLLADTERLLAETSV